MSGAGNGNKQGNRRTAWVLAAVVLLMFGFGFALVPLYDLFCEVTGTQSLSQRSLSEPRELAAPGVDETRWVTVKFDTMVNPDLPWEFEADTTKIRVHPGKPYEVNFKVRNRSNDEVTGQAIASVAPWQATGHFSKVECFCFSRQTLAGTEAVDMPLRFVVSSELPTEISSLTVSYNFLRARMGETEKQAPGPLPTISAVTTAK